MKTIEKRDTFESEILEINGIFLTYHIVHIQFNVRKFKKLPYMQHQFDNVRHFHFSVKHFELI